MSDAAGAADVVDEHVEPAEGVDGLLDHALDAILRRDVGLNSRDQIRALGHRLDFERGLRQPLLAARAQTHAAAFGHERSGAREPEPATRAGDDRNFVGEAEIHEVSG